MQFILYKNLNSNKILMKLNTLNGKITDEDYYEILSSLLEESFYNNLDKNLLKMYICFLISSDKNPLSLLAERYGKNIEQSLYNIALKDMSLLLELFNLDIKFTETEEQFDNNFNEIYKFLNTNPTKESLLDFLLEYYYKFGAGAMNKFKAFKWEKEEGLIGIENCDPIKLDELIGCDYQKEALIKNTENFLAGKPANNVLLFGDRGTGKSSSVKALLNSYSDKGLRIIELSKSDFLYFNKILAVIKNRGLKFIIFLDDLSFEEFETEYKYMKAVIDGGIEVKPDNVLIYATSNRRHLIRETWSDRKDDDIHTQDNRQEKLSLSDRFGLSLTYTSPAQDGYLKIVFELAKKYNIDLPENILREKAIQWELLHGNRSGRLAKQFITSLL